MSTTEDHTNGASGRADRQGKDTGSAGFVRATPRSATCRLHYVEAGEGPLIVLLHGFPEFWYGWRLQIQPLAAAGFRVVAPDTRGYNLSSRPERRRGLRHRPVGHRHPGPDPRTWRRDRDAGRSRLGRDPSPGPPR